MHRFSPAVDLRRCPACRRAAWLALPYLVLLATGPAGVAADPVTPGFVAGDEKPSGDDAAVRVPGGWMVAYDETIPGTGVTFRMLPVAGGTFRRGSPADEEGHGPEEGPIHEIRVEPYWMGRCEVTWAEYKAYMAACDLFKAMESARINPVTAANEADAVTAPSNLYDPTTTFTHGEEPLLPAATMTQFAARQYTKWLSGLTGRFHRLPTEAEWEYACRAGTATPFSAPAEEFDAIAWHAGNADDTTHEVGAKKPNAWGFHDMHGNVGEWVIDELLPDGYARQAALPQPVVAMAAIVWPTHLSPRVVRGGSYYDEPQRCRSAARRGSEDTAWKEVDPNLPKSPWWYTEEPALGVGMRIVRPFTVPDAAERRRWWEADIESIRADTADRLLQGRGARGIVSPTLQDQLKAAGLVK
ncbi:MAG: formylglycine-generating enzyme family protein [Planctomycetes bacterium]|nr:formylglycine-generating enzyme family protein [Planctomycetota bacterium]